MKNQKMIVQNCSKIKTGCTKRSKSQRIAYLILNLTRGVVNVVKDNFHVDLRVGMINPKIVLQNYTKFSN